MKRYGKYGRNPRLNNEKILKIWKKEKLISEKIWKIWKKDKLNSKMTWKIWKKPKLNSEKIWKLITSRLLYLMYLYIPTLLGVYAMAYSNK